MMASFLTGQEQMVPWVQQYGPYAGGGILILICLVFLVRRGGKKTGPATGGSLGEDLSSYPPAPPLTGSRQLRFDGVPGRLRLVVLAPIGKKDFSGEQAEQVLDQVVRGLGEVIKQDKPRLRVWPPQLSRQGFAPTFHREVKRPGVKGQPSNWVLVAGVAQAQGQQVLLGLALYLDEPTQHEGLNLDPKDWKQHLEISRSGS